MMETIHVILFHLTVIAIGMISAVLLVEKLIENRVKNAIKINNSEININPNIAGLGHHFYLGTKEGPPKIEFISIRSFFKFGWIVSIAFLLGLVTAIIPFVFDIDDKLNNLRYNVVVCVSALCAFALTNLIVYRSISKAVEEIFKKHHVYLSSKDNDLTMWLFNSSGYVYRAFIELRGSHLEPHFYTYHDFPFEDIDIDLREHSEDGKWSAYYEGEPIIKIDNFNSIESFILADNNNNIIKVKAL